MRTRPLDMAALTLVIIGAVNWGLIGFFRLDVIGTVFGGMESWISRIVYVTIAMAGLYCVSLFARSSDGYRDNRDHYHDVKTHE